MSEALYTSRCTVQVPGSLRRRATLETGQTFEMGVHGPIREFYRLEPERELPLPVDYIVAATAG
jgi:hypothetical protein